MLAGIRSAGGRIQSEIADNLPLRNIPRLTYALDDTLKKQAEILQKIHEAMADTPGVKGVAEGSDSPENGSPAARTDEGSGRPE